MNALAAHLEQMAPRLQSELSSRLQGFTGAILRNYLPQTWVFQSEVEAASLSVDRDGHASVAPAAQASPDVTIEARQEVLLAALERGRSANAHREDFHVTAHTRKGQTAFEFLRSRFGM